MVLFGYVSARDLARSANLVRSHQLWYVLATLGVGIWPAVGSGTKTVDFDMFWLGLGYESGQAYDLRE